MPRPLFLCCFALFAGCGKSVTGDDNNGSTSAPGQTAVVKATPRLAFDPSPANIIAGGTVTFAFGSVAHDVFFDATPGAPADIPGANRNVSTDRTFTTAGTFVYNCHIHPGMTGRVVVSPPAPEEP